MLAVLKTSKDIPHTVNLEKILFFYPIKSGACSRFEMEDGTLIDVAVPYEEVNRKLTEAGVSLTL